MMTRTIVILEDNVIYRERLTRAFEERHLSSFGCSDIASLKELLKDLTPDFAVIDLKIGEESGLNALPIIFERNPSCRAVILTGFGTIATTVEAMKRGAVHYLTKPSDPDMILAALTSLSSFQPESPDDIPFPSLAQVEWEHIQATLHECDGNISRAAKRLGMHRRSLQRKLSKNPGGLR